MPILRVTQASSVIRLVKAGKLTPVQKLPGLRGAYLFNRADIEALAAERAAFDAELGRRIQDIHDGKGIPLDPAQLARDLGESA